MIRYWKIWFIWKPRVMILVGSGFLSALGVGEPTCARLSGLERVARAENKREIWIQQQILNQIRRASQLGQIRGISQWSDANPSLLDPKFFKFVLNHKFVSFEAKNEYVKFVRGRIKSALGKVSSEPDPAMVDQLSSVPMDVLNRPGRSVNKLAAKKNVSTGWAGSDSQSIDSELEVDGEQVELLSELLKMSNSLESSPMGGQIASRILKFSHFNAGFSTVLTVFESLSALEESANGNQSDSILSDLDGTLSFFIGSAKAVKLTSLSTKDILEKPLHEIFIQRGESTQINKQLESKIPLVVQLDCSRFPTEISANWGAYRERWTRLRFAKKNGELVLQSIEEKREKDLLVLAGKPYEGIRLSFDLSSSQVDKVDVWGARRANLEGDRWANNSWDRIDTKSLNISSDPFKNGLFGYGDGEENIQNRVNVSQWGRQLKGYASFASEKLYSCCNSKPCRSFYEKTSKSPQREIKSQPHQNSGSRPPVS